MGVSMYVSGIKSIFKLASFAVWNMPGKKIGKRCCNTDIVKALYLYDGFRKVTCKLYITKHVSV